MRGQHVGDRKAKTGAAIGAADGRIGLRKTLKDRLNAVGRNADAGILDRNLDQVGIVRVRAAQDKAHMPLSGEFHGVAHQIQQDLPQLALIPDDPCRFGRRKDQRDTLLARCRLQDAQDSGHARRQGKGLGHQQRLSGLQLRQIEDIIDDLQQRFARVQDGFDIGPLTGVQRRFAQKLGNADHAVHRGANFMAHIRQKLRLCLRCLFRSKAGTRQLGLAFLDPADVTLDRD